jgi:hypothetical protein
MENNKPQTVWMVIRDDREYDSALGSIEAIFICKPTAEQIDAALPAPSGLWPKPKLVGVGAALLAGQHYLTDEQLGRAYHLYELPTGVCFLDVDTDAYQKTSKVPVKPLRPFCRGGE